MNYIKMSLRIVVIASILCAIQIGGCIKSEYTFESKYLYAWNLSDKSSTIESKAAFISEFVNKLSLFREDFASYNAVWLKTPDNSFDYNLQALYTLKNRLLEIKSMDPTSFQYNTAIQQITAQEQGEASKLIGVIQGCYDLNNYPNIWGWYGIIIWLVISIMGVFALSVLLYETSK